MTWLKYHKKAEEYFEQAEKLHKSDVELAEQYFYLAAEAEAKALQDLEPEKQRTLGITVVSTVSLYVRAGALKTAKDLAARYLTSNLLPNFTIQELHEILAAIASS